MKKTAITLSCLALLNACSSQPDIPVQDVEYQRYLDENTQALQQQQEQALDRAEQAQEKSEQQQLAFYSPGYARQVEDAVISARRASLNGQQQQLIDQAAKAMAWLQLGLQNKQQVKAQFATVLIKLESVQALQADKVQRRQYQAFMRRLETHFLALEQQQPPSEQDITDLLAGLELLQRTTLLTRYWQPAHDTLEQARSEQAQQWAEQSFSQAEQAVQNAELQIQAKASAEQAADTGLRALRLAQHALYIAREAKRLHQLSELQAEQAALSFEELLHQLSTALDGEDRRHMSLYDQMLSIKQRLDEINANKAASPQPE